ncbi:MAG: hypothetical protein AAF499_20075, partial [Pseudomonadota bacterium]
MPKRLSRDALLAFALIGLIALVSFRFPAFATFPSLLAVFNDTSILIMLALGQMAVVLTRCIDLSMASNLALTGMCTAMLNAVYPEIPIAALVLVAVKARLDAIDKSIQRVSTTAICPSANM